MQTYINTEGTPNSAYTYTAYAHTQHQSTLCQEWLSGENETGELCSVQDERQKKAAPHC